MNGLLRTVVIVAAIGAINWGLIGFFNWNLVDTIFGGGSREITSGFSRVIYALVGLAGVALLVWLPRLMTAATTRQAGVHGTSRRESTYEPPRPQA